MFTTVSSSSFVTETAHPAVSSNKETSVRKKDTEVSVSPKFFNKRRGRFEVPLLEVLRNMNLPELQVRHMSQLGLCPACGDKVEVVPETGKIILCSRDFAVFQELTRGEGGRKLGRRIMRLTPHKLEQIKKGDISLCPPREFLETVTGKTLEQGAVETAHGYCPVCEEPHRKSTKGIKAGKSGLHKILFCDDCRDIYNRRNKFARAITLLATGE